MWMWTLVITWTWFTSTVFFCKLNMKLSIVFKKGRNLQKRRKKKRSIIVICNDSGDWKRNSFFCQFFFLFCSDQTADKVNTFVHTWIMLSDPWWIEPFDLKHWCLNNLSVCAWQKNAGQFFQVTNWLFRLNSFKYNLSLLSTLSLCLKGKQLSPHNYVTFTQIPQKCPSKWHLHLFQMGEWMVVVVVVVPFLFYFKWPPWHNRRLKIVPPLFQTYCVLCTHMFSYVKVAGHDQVITSWYFWVNFTHNTKVGSCVT